MLAVIMKALETQNTLSCPRTNQSVSVPRIECAVVVIMAQKKVKKDRENLERYIKRPKDRGVSVYIQMY